VLIAINCNRSRRKLNSGNKKVQPLPRLHFVLQISGQPYLAAFAALIFAQRAFCTAAILARPAALIL
jgi:hypothetical protein